MPTTDEELAELQAAVEAKRQTLAQTQAQREASERSLVNDITAAQLMAEAAKLDAQIAQEESLQSRVGVDSNPTLAAATASMEQSVAQLEAQAEADRVRAEQEAEAKAAAEAEINAAVTGTADVPVTTEGGAS